MMIKQWTAQDVMSLSRSFQPACILAAAADLNIFTQVSKNQMTAAQMASQLNINPRATEKSDMASTV
ncbi:hypothetical protein ACFLZ8_03325, partial [Planctomycetota bacterium]